MMTPYQQGFMQKCAEYRLPFEMAYGLLKVALERRPMGVRAPSPRATRLTSQERQQFARPGVRDLKTRTGTGGWNNANNQGVYAAGAPSVAQQQSDKAKEQEAAAQAAAQKRQQAAQASAPAQPPPQAANPSSPDAAASAAGSKIDAAVDKASGPASQAAGGEPWPPPPPDDPWATPTPEPPAAAPKPATPPAAPAPDSPAAAPAVARAGGTATGRFFNSHFGRPVA